jgi:hypothetical protein
MVGLLLSLTAPADRLWIIGQTPQRVVLDVLHLMVRIVLVTACMGCS